MRFRRPPKPPNTAPEGGCNPLVRRPGTARSFLLAIGGRLSLTGGFWEWVSNLDLNLVGYGIVALFVLTWAGALAVWRVARIEEKWAAGMRSSTP